MCLHILYRVKRRRHTFQLGLHGRTTHTRNPTRSVMFSHALTALSWSGTPGADGHIIHPASWLGTLGTFSICAKFFASPPRSRSDVSQDEWKVSAAGVARGKVTVVTRVKWFHPLRIMNICKKIKKCNWKKCHQGFPGSQKKLEVCLNLWMPLW